MSRHQGTSKQPQGAAGMSTDMNDTYTRKSKHSQGSQTQTSKAVALYIRAPTQSQHPKALRYVHPNGK